MNKKLPYRYATSIVNTGFYSYFLSTGQRWLCLFNSAKSALYNAVFALYGAVLPLFSFYKTKFSRFSNSLSEVKITLFDSARVLADLVNPFFATTTA